MSSLEERKRQKEEYLAALELQRRNSNDVKLTNNGDSNSNNDDSSRNNALLAREKMLEDRKNKFLAKQQGNNGNEINLASYKKEGYPSEYAYALANGGLEIRRDKVPPPLPMPSINEAATFMQPKSNNYEMIQKPQVPIPSKLNNNHMDAGGNLPGNGIAIGVGINGIGQENEDKKVKQREYSRALAEQQQYNHNINAQADPYNAVPAPNPNDYILGDKMSKKKRQEEFAQLLRNDQQPLQGQPSNRQPPSYYENEIGVGVNGIGGGDDKAMKREKQNEYARALAQQQQFHFHQQQQELFQANAHVQLPHGQQPPQNDRAQGNVFGRGGILSMYGNDNGQNDKRRKQQEYARLLQEQQLFHINDESKKKPTAAPVQAVSSVNDPNVWVMGPLGVPVRKTIEVGNRGIQKAFYKASSPTKQPPIAQQFQAPMMNAPYQVPQTGQPSQYVQQPQHIPYPYPSQYPGYDNYQNPGMFPPAHGVGAYSNQYAHPSPVSLFPSLMDATPAGLHAQLHPVHMPIGGFDAISGMDNGLSGDSDERALRARYLQVEQAKGLEDQIRQNKLRGENEKRKKLEEEQREEERLEKQRIEMQKAFEKENNLAKVLILLLALLLTDSLTHSLTH